MNNIDKIPIKIGLVIVLLLMVSSCVSNDDKANEPVAAIADISESDSTVVWPIGQWPRSTPEEQGMDSEALQWVEDYMLSSNYELDSMLVVRNGYLVKESYFGSYDANTRHQIFSVTKSVLSVLIGIAIEEGAIEGLDQKIIDYFPQLAGDADESKHQITIKHLLTMTSGIDWPELAIPYTSPENPLVRMYEQENQIDFVLARDMAAAPGEIYNYSSADSHLLSAILQIAVGRTTEEYAKEKLFGPLGISDYEWPADNQGVSLGGAGLFLLPEDMARIGYLYLNKGLWVDEQVVPSAWVEQSTTLQASGLFQYGFQWRIGKDGDYYGMGYRGQFILVSPRLNLVVVFTSDANNEFLPLTLFDQLKKAVKDPDAASSDQAPRRFADGVITTAGATERALTFSPDGSVLLFHRRDGNFPQLYESRQVDGQWTEPQIVAFANIDDHYESAFFAPDGRKLFFASDRSGDRDDIQSNSYRIWVVDYDDGNWGVPYNPPQLNGDGEDAYPSVARDGTVYFTSNRSGGLGGYDLYRAEIVNGAYQAAVNLGPQINTPGDDYPAYIDPDGRFIIICRGYQMLISYPEEGSWTTPRPLALKSNPDTPLQGRAPYLSHDRKLLYYENDGDFYMIEWDLLDIDVPDGV